MILVQSDQVIEGAQGFLLRMRQRRAVELVKVNVVGLQASQGLVHRAADVDGRQLRVVRQLAHLAEDLGGHHHAVARHLQVAQRLAGDALRQAAGIDVGGVHEVDAGIEHGIQDAL